MSNEVKSALKEARDLLKQNEHEEAMKRCKKILKKDKSNYTALVLLGAAMREIEEYKNQAPLALQKATEIQPDNPLAWQGIVAYYEKEQQDDDIRVKLVSAYCKLLRLDSYSAKFSYFLDKISDLCLRLKNDSVLFEAIETLNDIRKNTDENKLNTINKTLAWIFMEHSSLRTNITTKYQEIILDVLKCVAQDVNIVNRQEYYREYLKALYLSNKFDDLLEEAIQMHKNYPDDIHSLNWICRIYYEQSILNNFRDFEITQYYEPLLQLNAQSESGIIAKAVYMRKMDNLIKSRECLNVLLSIDPRSFYGWVLLSEINSQLYCFDDAETAAVRALQFMKDERHIQLYNKLNLILVESLSKSNNPKKWEKAKEMAEKLLETDQSSQLKVILARTKILLNEDDSSTELEELESKADIKVEVTILRALNLKNQKQLAEAADVLGSVVRSSESWLLLGKIYWELEDYNHSLMAFLNGVQADRCNWECFIYLGHYYTEYGNDIERARKCYQTALQINPNSEQAGIGLSTAYRLLKKTDANMRLLEKVTSQGNGPKWAWLQLGLQHLDQENAAEAIKALRHVIRADPNDNHSWESLADAYLARGAYTSALKSYQRALELCPESIYPLIQLANIKLMIGQLIEAKQDFEHILQIKQHHVPALKSLAETCLSLAKENHLKQFLGRARDEIQQATDSLTEAIEQLNNLSCIWKLLGDCCYRTAMMPEKYCYLRVRSALLKTNVAEEYIIIKKTDLFLLSTRCYCRALCLCQDSSLLWHDLAACYYSQLRTVPSTAQKDIANKCFAAAKYAVKLCPTSWFHWNILGVISMLDEIKNYALAQHSFIMAIDREPNNPIAWCNLGTLYLNLGFLYKGNEAFSRAQRADPAYINSWIGQALIAEKMDKKEAMDLFRHSLELGYHDQGALGYAHWVLMTLLNPEAKKDPLQMYCINNMHAVPVATDALTWYIEYKPNNIYALNTYGLLLERQKLYRSAEIQFSTALSLCYKEYKEKVTKLPKCKEYKDYLCINLARVYIQLEKYSDAVQLCRTVETPSFNSRCHLALSLFRAKQYEDSYATYESALQWFANSESDKANTLCAMAAMLYTLQGVNDAKTLLFQCIQIKPPLIDGFLAAASIGILHKDLNLTTLVLKELQSYRDDSEYGYHIANLSAYSYLMQNDSKSAIRVLSKQIHRYPNNPKFWMGLVRILLEVDPKTFSKCAQKALFLGRNVSDLNMVHIACAASFSFSTKSFMRDGFKSSQKTLFSFPANIESWTNFIAVATTKCRDYFHNPNFEWLEELIYIIRKNMKAEGETDKWLHNIAHRFNALNSLSSMFRPNLRRSTFRPGRLG